MVESSIPPNGSEQPKTPQDKEESKVNKQTEEKQKEETSVQNPVQNPDTPTKKQNSAKKISGKDVSADIEIFALMNEKTLQLTNLQPEIKGLEAEIERLKSYRSSLQEQIKPVRKVVKRFNPDGKEFPKISPETRKTIRHTIKLITNQIILKEDLLWHKKSQFSVYSDAVSEEMKKNGLINKAQSLHWTTRNGWSIKGRLIRFLNNLLNENRTQINELSRLAKSTAENSKEDFSKFLKEVLDEIDPETSILCSYRLKNELYEALRLTLLSWDPESGAEFTELILPKTK